VGFQSGSAFAMVRDIADGYLLVTERTFRQMNRADLDQMTFELERHVRELRGEHCAPDDVAGNQQRNRKIQRVNSATVMLRATRQRMKL
jgi:hypothetical protein